MRSRGRPGLVKSNKIAQFKWLSADWVELQVIDDRLKGVRTVRRLFKYESYLREAVR